MKTSFRYLVVIVMMLSAWGYMSTHRDKPTPLPDSLSNFPSAFGDWRLFKEAYFDQQALDMLRPTEYLSKRYARQDGAVVDIYVGFHDGARQSGGIHSPKNCLPGSGWFEVSSEQVKVNLKEQPLDVVVSVYQHGASTDLILYWFQVGGESVSNEYSMKIHEVLNSVRYGRRDAAFIRIIVPISGSKEAAMAQAEDFLKAMYPSLKRILPS